MSVLKCHRGVSKAEFVNTANNIYTYTLIFLSRLSARYSRLIAQDTIHLAHSIVENTVKANSMMAVDEMKFNLRRRYLIEARASLSALDVQMTHIWELLMQNPEGAFENKNKSEALQKLNKMAEDLGCMIDFEEKLINGVLKSDKNFYEIKRL